MWVDLPSNGYTLWVYNEFTYDEYHEKSENTKCHPINVIYVYNSSTAYADKLTETYSR
jgi:hypothetical protein